MDKNDKSTERLPFFLIDLMKSVLNDESGVEDKADVLLFEIGRQLVNCNARNEPTADLEYLYDTTQWLLKDVIKLSSGDSVKVNIADFIEMYSGKIPSATLYRLHSLLNRGEETAEMSNEEMDLILQA